MSVRYASYNRPILVVEDNPGDIVLIKEYLKEEFLNPVIEHATSFTAAKNKLQNNHSFGIILLDLSLPDASGELLVTEMVHLAAGHCPIIVLTGYSDKEFGIKTLALGISDYLLKDELTGAQLCKSIMYSSERGRISSELKESEEKYRNLFGMSPIPMWVYELDSLRFVKVNEAAIKHYGYSEEEFLSMTLFDIRPKEEEAVFKMAIAEIHKNNTAQKAEYRHLKKNGEIIDVEVHGSEIYFGEKRARLVLSIDITLSNYHTRILAMEKEIYEMNASAGSSFTGMLNNLTKNIEELIPQSFCTILQKDETNALRNLSGNSMPPAFMNLVDGLLISPQTGSCGTAIATGKNIIVSDIETDPLWQNYRLLIRPFGFKACWSVPIKQTDGKVIGSFATYFKSIKTALDYQINLLERAASLVGILIENRNAAEDIRKSNDRYDIVIWDRDLTSNIITWNKGLKGIFGYNELNNTTYGDWWKRKVHPEDLERVTENIQLHIDNKITKWQDEYRFRCADGTYKYIFDRGFLLIDENNNPLKMIGAMQDITHQKEEEHRLKLLESVITNTSDAVMITEAEPLDYPGPPIIYVNEAFTKMTGYTAAEVIGKTPRILLGAKSDKKELKLLDDAMRKWETKEITVINYKKNGEEFWNNISLSPVADEKGWYTHWIAVERDVTASKKLDQEITKAIINAQEQERFQIGGELHDNVNQILAGVLLNLGMTRGKPVTTQSEWIEKSVSYVHMAISEIRKLSHRLAPASFEENSLEEVLKDLIKSININNQYEIKFQMDGLKKQQIDDDIQLNLYRILQEQLNNIMKYSKASVIEISLAMVNKTLHFRIYDNGAGFDTKKYVKGIGLNNIKKRTELFSGAFALQSSPGNGCEILVEIPLP
jgi:PAS domain S-box-containing protein